MTTSAPEPTIPVLDLDPYADDVLTDPTSFHTVLREAGPVVWLSRYDVYAAGGYDEVRAGLTNHLDLVSSAGVGLADLRQERSFRTPSLLIEADPPAHTARRVIMDAVLGTRALRGLREQVDAAAERVVDAALANGTVDGITELAEALPLTVFPELVGFSESVRPHLLTYGDLVFNSGGPPNAHFEHALAQAGPAIAAIAEQTKRENLTQDGIGARIWARVDSGELPEDEASLLIRSLLTAGVDTTVSAIAATLHHLAAAPEQWELLRADPRMARFAFEEAIRHDSPVQTFYRTTARAVDLGGVTLRAGAKILLSLGAANHDPRRFADPGRFDLTRTMSGHVGFGMGVHQCVGQHLGRLEGEALLRALAARVGRLEPAGEPERRLNNTLRGWRTLPLRLT